jgi:CDP-glucose 4,6-dehydratase
MLHELGAETVGYALAPEAGSLYEKIDGGSLVLHSEIADVRDAEKLLQVMQKWQPEIVLHLAAQAIVKKCFENPHYTYETNVMGTVNLFEAIRSCPSVKSVLVVTSDKVYENKGDGAVYVETDCLGGIDPYSASKACMELVTDSYKRQYLQADNRMVGVSTARASNVIGGGDHVQTRLIPSILNSFAEGKLVELRNPNQTRPWQSVLDALNGYLSIARLQHEEQEKYSSQWNIGPGKENIRSVADIVAKMQVCYETDACFMSVKPFEVIESKTLGLDISKSLARLDWKPVLSLDKTLYLLVDFFKRQRSGESERNICLNQIKEFYK